MTEKVHFTDELGLKEVWGISLVDSSKTRCWTTGSKRNY